MFLAPAFALLLRSTNMEDAHTVQLSLKSHPSITYIGMFDGHNGAAAAEFMAKEMPDRLNALADPTDHAQLTAAVEKADADFMSDINLRAHGSTACLALIKHGENGARKLTVANVGDSRCLVIDANSGTCKFTTVDHKPDTESEAARIRAAGGSVSFGRVDGDLAMVSCTQICVRARFSLIALCSPSSLVPVLRAFSLSQSRSIGDHTYKNVSHLGALTQKVVPTPDCSDYDLLPSDIVLVCCDGLVEKLTNQQVASHIHDQIAAQQSKGTEVDPAPIMQSLLELSLARGSKDNMSAALLIPVDGSTYSRADEYCVGPYSEWASDRAFGDAFFADARKHGFNDEQTRALVAAYNGRPTAAANATAAAAAAAAAQDKKELEKILLQ